MGSSVLICDDSNMARKQVLRSLPEQLSKDVQLAKKWPRSVRYLTNK